VLKTTAVESGAFTSVETAKAVADRFTVVSARPLLMSSTLFAAYCQSNSSLIESSASREIFAAANLDDRLFGARFVAGAADSALFMKLASKSRTLLGAFARGSPDEPS